MAIIDVVVSEPLRGKALEEVVEADLRGFEAWFTALGNGPLAGPEAAILKTYLFFKTQVPERKNPPAPIP